MKNSIKKRVRELRQSQTKAEKIMWERLRNRQLLNFKFLRQHPIIFQHFDKERFFVADFYCAEKALIVEIDGGVHRDQKEQDRYRDFLCRKLGFEVVRFTNSEVMNDLDSVLEKLEKVLGKE